MITTKNLKGYNISKDYNRLVELMGYGYSVLCGFEYRSGLVPTFGSVACVKANGRYAITTSASDDGINFLVFSEKTVEEFITKCKQAHVTFIDIQLP